MGRPAWRMAKVLRSRATAARVLSCFDLQTTWVRLEGERSGPQRDRAVLPTSCPTFKRPRPYTAIAGDFRCLPGLTAFFRIAVRTAEAGRARPYEECRSRAASNKQEVWTLHGMAPGASIGNIFETKAGTQCIRQQRDQMRTSVARGLKVWQVDDLATALLIAKFYDLLSQDTCRQH